MHFTSGNEIDFIIQTQNDELIEHIRTLIREGYTGKLIYFKGIVAIMNRLGVRDLEAVRSLYSMAEGTRHVFLICVVYNNQESSVI